jgi:ribosome-associated heat shock protein Hsp15
MADAPVARQRLDKWLWFARLAKTRTSAQKLAVSGHVRINREKADSASQPVKIGDVLTVGLDAGVRVLKVAAPGARRGPPAEARLLYEDLSPPPAVPPVPSGAAAAERGGSRPTKRDRRALDALRGPRQDFSADGE